MPISIESNNYKGLLRYKAKQLLKQPIASNLAQRVRDDIRLAQSPEKVMLALDRWVTILRDLPGNSRDSNFSVSYAVYSGIAEAIQGTPLQTYLPGPSRDCLSDFASLAQQYSASSGSDDSDGTGLFIGEGSEPGSPFATNKQSIDTPTSLIATEIESAVAPITLLLSPKPKDRAFSETLRYLQRVFLQDSPDIDQLVKAISLWLTDRVTTAFNEQSEATLVQSIPEQMRALVQGSIEGLATQREKVLFGWWLVLDKLHQEGHDCAVDALLSIEDIQNDCPFVDTNTGEVIKGNFESLKLFLQLRAPIDRQAVNFAAIQQFEQARQTKEVRARQLTDESTISHSQDFLSASIDLFIDLYERRQEYISTGDEDSIETCRVWLGRLWLIYESTKTGVTEEIFRDFLTLKSEVIHATVIRPLELQMDLLQQEIQELKVWYANIVSKPSQQTFKLHELLKAITHWPESAAVTEKSIDEISLYGYAFLELFLPNVALVEIVLANGYSFNSSADAAEYDALKTTLKEDEREAAKGLLNEMLIDELPSWQIEYVIDNKKWLERACVASDEVDEDDDEFITEIRLSTSSKFPSNLRLSQSSHRLDQLVVTNQSTIKEKCIDIFELANNLTDEVSIQDFYSSLKRSASGNSPTTVDAKYELLSQFSHEKPKDANAKIWRKIVNGCEQLGYRTAKDSSQLDQELMMRLQIFITMYRFLEKHRTNFQIKYSSAFSFLKELSGLTPMMQVMRLQHHVHRNPRSNSTDIWQLTQSCIKTLSVSTQNSDLTACVDMLINMANSLCLSKSGGATPESLLTLRENLLGYIENQLPLLKGNLPCQIHAWSPMGATTSTNSLSSLAHKKSRSAIELSTLPKSPDRLIVHK